MAANLQSMMGLGWLRVGPCGHAGPGTAGCLRPPNAVTGVGGSAGMGEGGPDSGPDPMGGVDPMPARLIPRAGGSTRRQEGAESGPFSGSGLRWERWVPGLPRRVLPVRFPTPISESMWVYRPMCQGPGPMSLMFSEIGVGNRAGMFPSGARVQHRSPACGGGGWWLLPALGDAWDCGA